ncbi:MAG: hypothetical protein US89_C0005G0078 [Candidatus Peregrinibacteria bacterium GW2011_GWF2_38_29]|nr:MAG: hypothetical protein US89_C0005G0078 [Candidatus Peregrinibacteria bacterium GW2011_GWF2_38_29]HBB02665.1 hypothetical protein [Candidatus Peregrinibacteria bacterium]
MKIIFPRTASIKENIENDKIDIIKAVVKGIFVTIKGISLPKYSQLIKIYITTRKGARRTVFLVNMKDGDKFFLFYRSKNDEIGKNISVKNPKFKNELVKYLLMLEKDVDDNNLDIYTL